MIQLERVFTWSNWQLLQECWLEGKIPSQPGIYRIRRVGHEQLDYIGQTGSGTMTLRKRLAMLRGIYAEQMPYRDPHTAAPALWALRHQSGCDFEVSVLPVQGSTPWRKGLEALAISLYRQAYGRSPTINFGRMPIGYRMSSGNTAKLEQAGLRFRGGLTSKENANHLPSITPVNSLAGDPTCPNWCGHSWSDWVVLDTVRSKLLGNELGLYRIQGTNQVGLVYIGQGNLRQRLSQHDRKFRLAADEQGQVLRQAGRLSCSWVENSIWYTHQRLELENDLIAAHLLQLKLVPPAQFLG